MAERAAKSAEMAINLAVIIFISSEKAKRFDFLSPD
jgi:hypothetical protein